MQGLTLEEKGKKNDQTKNQQTSYLYSIMSSYKHPDLPTYHGGYNTL